MINEPANTDMIYSGTPGTGTKRAHHGRKGRVDLIERIDQGRLSTIRPPGNFPRLSLSVQERTYSMTIIGKL